MNTPNPPGTPLVSWKKPDRFQLKDDTDVKKLISYREIMAVCSEIHTKHINTVCGQNVELLNVKLVVHIVTTGL